MSDEGRKKRFMQNMPESLAALVDDFADAYGLTRNGAVNFLVTRGLTSDVTVRAETRNERAGGYE